MKTKLLFLPTASVCTLSGAAFGMTKVEYTAQKDTISGNDKVSRDKFNSLAPSKSSSLIDVMTKLTPKNRLELPAIEFAFQAQRKEPLENASHVRNGIACFNQVKGVGNTERDTASYRILISAKKYGVDVHDTSWRDIGRPANEV